MFEELQQKIEAKLTEALDGALPDGVTQKLAGELLVLIGDELKAVGTALGGTENEDGDE